MDKCDLLEEIELDPQIEKYNEFLSKTDDKFDIVGGYESILSALVNQVGEIYGDNTSKNFCYQIGTKPGEKIAKKILETRNGQLFEDPAEAFVNLVGRLKAYYKIKILEIQKINANTTKISFLNNCYLDRIYQQQKEVSKGAAICRVTKGYLETSLKILTGKKVIYESSVKSDALCHAEITFS